MAPAVVYPNEIETIEGGGYFGTMEAEVYELNELGSAQSTQMIRTSQAWGVKVRWEMHGVLVATFPCDFELQLYLDRMGPGTDFGPFITVPINSLSVPLNPGLTNVDDQRVYGVTPEVKIQLAAGAVPAGVYEVVVILQARIGTNKQPYAGIVTLRPVDIFTVT